MKSTMYMEAFEKPFLLWPMMTTRGGFRHFKALLPSNQDYLRMSPSWSLITKVLCNIAYLFSTGLSCESKVYTLFIVPNYDELGRVDVWLFGEIYIKQYCVLR